MFDGPRCIRRIILSIVCVGICVVVPSRSASAQTANPATPAGLTVQRGCYVLPTGLVYRVGEKGLPANCTSTEHVAFSWLVLDSTSAPVSAAPPENTPNGAVLSINGARGNVDLKTGGGLTVTRSGDVLTITPGQNNQAVGSWAAVSGGTSNSATGDYAAVPGGMSNSAGGAHSMAGGKQAKAEHEGTFVWSDGRGTSPFASTGSDQFLIKAAGGVGIGTNVPAPGFQLDVSGDVHTSGTIKIGSASGSAVTSGVDANANIELATTLTSASITTTSLTTGTVTSAGQVLSGTLVFNGPAVDIATPSGQHLALMPSAANVGIGIAIPEEKLQVAGNVRATRFLGDGSGLTGVISSGLTAGTYANQYAFTNALNTFNGIHTGNGAGLTGVTAASASALTAGSYGNQYAFTNALNTFNGIHTGNGAGLTGVTNATASALTAGTYAAQLNLTNTNNQIAGRFAGDGSALTGVTTSGLNAGTYGNQYAFTNALNTFNGIHTGNGAGLTGVTNAAASALIAGTYAAQLALTNANNQITGRFTGDGSALTGVSTSGLAAGTYANQYALSNPLNIFSGTFTGDGSGLTGVSTSGLASGVYSNAYAFGNALNEFNGKFAGDGTWLTGIPVTALVSGTSDKQFAFTHAQNSFKGVFDGTFDGTFSGDGSRLTGITVNNTTLVQKGGDTMTGALTLDTNAGGAILATGNLVLKPHVDKSVIVGDPTGLPASQAKLRVVGEIQSTTGGIRFPDGTLQESTGWSANGNQGLSSSSFIGHIDDIPLFFKTRNATGMRLQVQEYQGDVGFNFVAGVTVATFTSPGSTLLGGTFTSPNSVGSHATGAAVLGGTSNTASGTASVVAGGAGNQASDAMGAVLGGQMNEAGYFATVVGGSRGRALGMYSIVLGGDQNEAMAENSIAMGSLARVRSDDHGAFVFNASGSLFESQVESEFAVLAPGGVRFLTSCPTGTCQGAGAMAGVGVVLLPGSGSWRSSSDINIKRDIVPVDVDDVLRRIAAMPISRWSYKAQEAGIRHMGPMAQDFRKAFGLGENDTGINVVDADGVSLAGVQALEKRTATLQQENEALRKEVARLRTSQEEVLRRLTALEQQK